MTESGPDEVRRGTGPRREGLAGALGERRARSSLVLGAPVTGALVPLAEVPDKVFSSGALGDGVGIVPATGQALAPVGGTVQAAMPHAYGISAGDVEVLVHIGVDTVALNGRHFTQVVEPGAVVGRGAPLAEFDIDGIRADGYDPVVMFIVTRRPARASMVFLASGEVVAGADLVELSAE